MITTAIISAAAIVFTISSYINTGVNTANLAYDKKVVAESLSEMNQTAKLLKEKAELETDPDLRQKKLLVAQKLEETHEKMDSLQDTMITRTARKEFASLVKGAVVGNLDRISKIGELGGQIAGTIDGSIDTTVAIRQTVGSSTVDDIAMWKVAAKSSESIDLEIAKVEARQKAKELAGLNDELAMMIRDLDEQEKADKISSEEYEKKLGGIVIENPTRFNIDEQDALSGLDTDTSNLGDTAKNNGNHELKKVDPGSILGDWVILKWKDNVPSSASKALWKYRFYRFMENGKAIQNYGHIFELKYTLDSIGKGMLEITNVTGAPQEYLNQQVVQERYFSQIGKKQCFLFDGETIYLYPKETCDPNSTERYTLKPRK